MKSLNRSSTSHCLNRLSAKKIIRSSSLGLLVALLCSIPAVQAATWNGGGGNNNWTTPDNWGGTAPVATDPLVFSGTTQLSSNNNFAANTQFNGITFDAGTGGFTFAGNAINLGGNIVNNSTGSQLFNTALVLLQNTSITNNTTGNLTFGNTISGNFVLTKLGTGNLVLNNTGSFTGITVSEGILRGSANSTQNVFGTGGISLASGTTLELRPIGTNTVVTSNIISGAGTVRGFGQTAAAVQVLSGSNTYTGLTTISSGVLNIRNATALGTTAQGTTVASGATLQIENNITVGAEALSLTGTGDTNKGALRNISGTNIYGGLVTLTGATRINSDAGTLTLSNAGTITGATFGLTVGGAGDTTIDSAIGTTSGTLTKDGAGTLKVTAANTYTGATLVSAGTMIVNGTLNNTSGVTVSGGALQLGASERINNAATLTLSGGTLNTEGFSETFGTLTLSNATASTLDFATGGSIVLFSGITTGNGTLALNNWVSGSDSLRFTSNTNLSASSFTINGGAATILNQGAYYEVVPEPTTCVLLALSLITVPLLHRRRRA